MSPRLASCAFALLLPAVSFSGCGGPAEHDDAGTNPGPLLRIALAPHAGDSALDQRIRDAQRAARTDPDVDELELLARCFIEKARASADPGYYRLAESAAESMPDPDQPAALLIRGHVRHALHDFAAAERIGRRLVAERGMFLDLGLLGDVLLDRGRFEQARDVYQRMLDQKPCLQSYARAAEVRWQQGDVEGSRELLELAARAGSRRAPEALAWVLTRRAELSLHAGAPQRAVELAGEALQHVADYAPALVVRGRARLADGAHEPALQDLGQAASCSPLPANLWAHADALRLAGRGDEAGEVERQLRETGEREDPRTFAVWLATAVGTEADTARAVVLAEREYELRQDCMTCDALAWSRFRAGDQQAARQALDLALANGSHDARLRLHAAALVHAAGEHELARHHCAIASAGRAALLPSERRLLDELRQEL